MMDWTIVAHSCNYAPYSNKKVLVLKLMWYFSEADCRRDLLRFFCCVTEFEFNWTQIEIAVTKKVKSAPLCPTSPYS